MPETLVKACGEPYQAIDLELRFCGRPLGHDGHHYVNAYPFDPKPSALETASCVECGLIDPVDRFTLCSTCWQQVHADGACVGSCPFCGDLICALCIDKASGGWHDCGTKDPDVVSIRREPVQ